MNGYFCILLNLSFFILIFSDDVLNVNLFFYLHFFLNFTKEDITTSCFISSLDQTGVKLGAKCETVSATLSRSTSNRMAQIVNNILLPNSFVR